VNRMDEPCCAGISHETGLSSFSFVAFDVFRFLIVSLKSTMRLSLAVFTKLFLRKVS
jgi:hypothetical protein